MYPNIIKTRKILFATCCLLFIGLLSGSVIAFGQTEPTPNSTATPSATSTPTPPATQAPASTPQPLPAGMALNISADPSILTINTSTDVTFTVTTAGVPVDNATVTLGGVFSANRTTGPAGNTVIKVNATYAGKISAVASKEGYTIGTTILTVTGEPSPFSNQVIIVTIVGEFILFLLTSCGKFGCPEEQDEKSNGSVQGMKHKLKWFNITPPMFVSFSVVWISSAVWLWGSMENNFLIATLGAGVLGGIIYDIVVNKGDIILPRVDPDGISLGALYGGALGFASAIMIINSVYQIPSPQINLNHSLLAFLSALGLKGFSEFSATAQLIPIKKKAAISFNLDTTGPKTVKVDGEIVIKENDIERQVVHVNFQKDNNVSIIRDIVTTNENPKKFQSDDITLDSGTWEAWASWDGNDKYDKAESRHQKFDVK